MPRLMDALSFFIDAPNFVRSCGQGKRTYWVCVTGSIVTVQKVTVIQGHGQGRILSTQGLVEPTNPESL